MFSLKTSSFCCFHGYPRYHEIFPPRNSPPTLQCCLHALKCGPVTFFFATCTPLMVPLIYRVPFSSCPVCGYWRSEQKGENRRNTAKKTGPVYLSFTAEKMAQVARYASTRCGKPVTQDSTLKHSIFPHWNQNSHHMYQVQSIHFVIRHQRYNIVPRNLKPWNLILGASFSILWKSPPIK